MGLKKGPWTPEEDQILISYIQKNGHGNWRALPKQAGLLRCGKSCRLRWTNYLRPDIKRGNFSKEEEEAIIQLHEMLGNRWSAIAARLPGRTDNEIKNVWHTHLKKKLKNYNQTSQETKRQQKSNNSPTKPDSKTVPISETNDYDYDDDGDGEDQKMKKINNTNIINASPVSPQHSSSELSSVTADSSLAMATTGHVNDHGRDTLMVIKNEEMESSEKYFPEIDESFWSEEILSEEKEITNTIQLQCAAEREIYGMFMSDHQEVGYQFPFSPSSSTAIGGSGEDVMNAAFTSRLDDGMDFWYDLFIRAGDLPELPEF